MASSNDATVLTIPGLWNSGAEHWQSYWERAHGYRRVLQNSSAWLIVSNDSAKAAPMAAIMAG